MKIWHAASNNGINLFKIIVSNNRNYNLKGIIDNYDCCHNRAALLFIFCIIQQRQAINHCIVCSFGHVTLKKLLVILLVTSHK